jgi:hypothetical protein
VLEAAGMLVLVLLLPHTSLHCNCRDERLAVQACGLGHLQSNTEMQEQQQQWQQQTRYVKELHKSA